MKGGWGGGEGGGEGGKEMMKGFTLKLSTNYHSVISAHHNRWCGAHGNIKVFIRVR